MSIKMTRKQYRRFACCALAFALALATESSAAGLSRRNEIDVVSEPLGATVYAAGKELGVTPLTVRQQDVFPVVYSPDQQDVYGTLLLVKEGCKEQRVRVSTAVIRKGVNVKLDCGQAELAQPQAGGTGAPLPTIKERILRLNELHEQGLVSAEEYQEIRRKILGEL